MDDDLTPAILAQCRIIEDAHDRTIDYAHLGALRSQVQQTHTIMLATWKRETTFAASHATTSAQKAECRILWLLIDDEQKARKAGKRPSNLERARLSIQARCEVVHQNVPITHFLERECGVTLVRNRCKCPIHDGDNQQAFSVRHDRGRCFVCNWSGDVIALAQQFWGLSRPVEAIRRLERWT